MTRNGPFRLAAQAGRLTVSLAAVSMSVILAGCGSPQLRTVSVSLPSFARAVVSAPVGIAQTRLGAVGYRVVGTGPPLILITGYTATINSWDPRFVGALAQHYRVVTFDNAGIGRTRALSAPLTIDAMANQTSALIDTLGLSKPDVLGWSMGGTIAQALAVLHPAQVSRLVLCATFPGTGTVAPPSLAAAQALTSGSPQEVMADLFPANQVVAQQAYLAATAAYPPHAPAPAAAIAAQGQAIDLWFGGTDPAGQKTATISVPTLIADGTVDRLDPLSNDYALARLIAGASCTPTLATRSCSRTRRPSSRSSSRFSTDSCASRDHEAVSEWQGEIRSAAAGDLDGVASLAADMAQSFPFSADSFGQTYRSLLGAADVSLLVAVRGQERLGYLLGFRHLTFYANGSVGWVEEIAVRREDRGCGIGRALMNAFEDWAGQRNCTLVALATRRAAPFYRALGYQENAAYFRKVL